MLHARGQRTSTLCRRRIRNSYRFYISSGPIIEVYYRQRCCSFLHTWRRPECTPGEAGLSTPLPRARAPLAKLQPLNGNQAKIAELRAEVEAATPHAEEAAVAAEPVVEELTADDIPTIEVEVDEIPVDEAPAPVVEPAIVEPAEVEVEAAVVEPAVVEPEPPAVEERSEIAAG